MKTRLATIGALLLLCGLLGFTSQEKHGLTVNIDGAIPGKGQAVLSVFSSADTYLKKPLLGKTKPIDGQGRVSFQIDGLATGTYSVSVFYDEDEDGELKTNFLGIPKELVGFSNNAKGSFGPPSFEKTSFELKATKTITIHFGKARD